MPTKKVLSKTNSSGRENPIITIPRGTIKRHKNLEEEEVLMLGRRLRQALEKPVNSAVVIAILTKHTLEERKYIEDLYSVQYEDDLQEVIRREFLCNLQDTLVTLLQWESRSLADWTHRAIRGSSTDGKCLVEILCGRKQGEIEEVVGAYRSLHGRSLTDALRSALRGDFMKLMVQLVDLKRPEERDVVGDPRARPLAQDLVQAGEARRGHDTEVFTRIFCTSSYPLLARILDVYPEVSPRKRGLEETITSQFSGDMRSALLAIAQSTRNQPGYFAERLYRSMRGPGTDDDTLIRILVTRSERDLQNVKDSYQRSYGKSLAAAVADDTSGDYRKCLLAIIKS